MAILKPAVGLDAIVDQPVDGESNGYVIEERLNERGSARVHSSRVVAKPPIEGYCSIKDGWTEVDIYFGKWFLGKLRFSTQDLTKVLRSDNSIRLLLRKKYESRSD